MKLVAYLIDGQAVDIRPAPVERDWMDTTHQRFAYRCLPLNIANAHGWEIFCNTGFTAIWNGGWAMDAIDIRPDPGTKSPASSHFAHGILTFPVPCVFRTEPGFDLMVQGPINRPKDGISPLSAVIETDWAPYTFTMNWVFTHPGMPVRFDKGEPFCHLFPIRRGELETISPQLRSISEEPELERQYKAWQGSRSQFNADLKTPGSQAQRELWQKKYYQGVDFDQRAAVDDHRTRLRLRPFQR